MDISLRDVMVTLSRRSNLQPVVESLSHEILFRIKKLDIPAGSRVFIEGASGLGKSTLLHLIAGLFLPESGVINIGEHAFHEMSDGARSRVRREHFSMIFQKLNLVDHLTAVENVRLGLFEKKSSAADTALAALSRVGLKSRAADRTGVLSLGEQQRVAIARVLAACPDIVLADEPTSSLDARNADVVVGGLLDVAKNSTVVVVSHDQRIRSNFSTILQFKDLIA